MADFDHVFHLPGQSLQRGRGKNAPMPLPLDAATDASVYSVATVWRENWGLSNKNLPMHNVRSYELLTDNYVNILCANHFKIFNF